jgi:GntR family transcriptional regulator of vanillate catabolism
MRAALARALAAGDAVVARGTLEPADLAAFRDANSAFHEAILAASGNPRLAGMVRQCQSTPPASTRRMWVFSAAQLRRSHDDHHRIEEAVLAGQGARAEALMREHVASLKAVLRAMRDGTLSAA